MHYHFLLDPKRKQFENKEEVISRIPPGSAVVDLGCGPGYYCPDLRARASILYCVDTDPEALQMARERTTGAVFLNSTKDIPENGIDVVVMANSFHDMDRERMKGEILRVIKPGGIVIVVDWKKEPTPLGPPLHIRMSEEDYIREFRVLRLLERFSPGPYQYGLVLEKPKGE